MDQVMCMHRSRQRIRQSYPPIYLTPTVVVSMVQGTQGARRVSTEVGGRCRQSPRRRAFAFAYFRAAPPTWCRVGAHRPLAGRLRETSPYVGGEPVSDLCLRRATAYVRVGAAVPCASARRRVRTFATRAAGVCRGKSRWGLVGLRVGEEPRTPTIGELKRRTVSLASHACAPRRARARVLTACWKILLVSFELSLRDDFRYPDFSDFRYPDFSGSCRETYR
jgi:hypothetical protein